MDMNDDERKQIGTQLRNGLRWQLEEEVQRLGGKMGIKQAIIEAALYTYFSCGEAGRDTLVERILASDKEGGTKALVNESREKAKRAEKPHSTPAKGTKGRKA